MRLLRRDEKPLDLPPKCVDLITYADESERLAMQLKAKAVECRHAAWLLYDESKGQLDEWGTKELARMRREIGGL